MKRNALLKSWLCLPALALLLAPAGCGLYVNIPPQRGDIALHAADWVPVREIVTDAANHLAAQRGLHDDPYTFIVPEDGDAGVYELLTPRLIGSPQRDSAAGLAVLEVLKVRVRGSDAEVDLYVAPEPSQIGDTITVYLSWLPASNWSVDRTRLWRGGIEPGEPGKVKTSANTPPPPPKQTRPRTEPPEFDDQGLDSDAPDTRPRDDLDPSGEVQEIEPAPVEIEKLDA